MNNNELIKHTAAVHISNSLSLNQRKTANILLKKAYSNLKDHDTHAMSLQELENELGWSSKTNRNDNIKEAIRALNRTQVEWNLLGKDKKNKWGVTTLLSGAEIEDGMVYYRYDTKLRELLSTPTIYARLNLMIQKRFTGKHSIAIWEFVSEALCSSSSKKIIEILTIDRFRKLLAIEKNKYPEFKKLNNKVIKPAIDEINRESDVNISIEYLKENRKVSSLAFSISKKDNFTLAEDNLKITDEDLAKFTDLLITKYDFNFTVAQNILLHYPLTHIKKILEYADKMIKTSSIIEPAAYICSLLKSKWIPKFECNSESTPQELLEHVDRQLLNLHQNPLWILVIQDLKNIVEPNLFRNWLIDLSFDKFEEKILYLTSPLRFKVQRIKSNFMEKLETVCIQHFEDLSQIKITTKKN